MASYRRVTYEDRCQIHALLQVNFDTLMIAQELGFHRTTIFREIKRNCSFRYHPKRAQWAARRRFLSCRRNLFLQGELEQKVIRALQRGWSPRQISLRFGSEQVGVFSHQCVYDYVGRNRVALRGYLRRSGRRGAGRIRQRTTRLTVNKRWISERPKIANKRKRIGDWERDTMYCANRKLLLVCTDRKTRFTKLAKLESYKIKHTSEQTIALLRSTNRKIYTITNDNGPEFRDGPNLPVRVFYCEPKKPQQRGTVENTIGLLRQYIKRSTTHRELTRKRLQEIEDSINFRPKRCLDYLTPYEAFYGKRVALAT